MFGERRRAAAESEERRLQAEVETRRHRQVVRVTWLGVGLAVVGVAVAIAAWAFRSPGMSLFPTAAEVAPRTSLAAVTTWPMIRGCDGATGVAMTSTQAFRRPAVDKGGRAAVVAAGGAAWSGGTLTLSLSTLREEGVQVVNLHPTVKRLGDGTSWLFTPDGGCGGGGGESALRQFDLDLDEPALFDLGVTEQDHAPAHATASAMGGPINIRPAHPVLVEINAYACKGNYSWSLDLQYVAGGDPTLRHLHLGPYQVLGRLVGAVHYTGQTSDGSDAQVTSSVPKTAYFCHMAG